VSLARLLAGTAQSAEALTLLASLRNDVSEARDLFDVAEATALRGQHSCDVGARGAPCHPDADRSTVR
jgi:hypothetical protein